MRLLLTLLLLRLLLLTLLLLLLLTLLLLLLIWSACGVVMADSIVGARKRLFRGDGIEFAIG